MTLRPTTLYLIRHGETQWNALGKIQGTKDISLSEAGEWQAMQVAERLFRDRPFDCIYSSQLKRAYLTANVISKRLGLPHLTDTRLQERNYGILEGLTHNEIISSYPDFSFQKEMEIEGLETLADLTQKISTCLEDIAHQHPGKRIVVVSHGATLKAFMRSLLIPDTALLGNTSVTVFERNDSGFIPLLINDTSHLLEHEKKERFP